MTATTQPWGALITRAILIEHAQAAFEQTGGGTNFSPKELECIDSKLGSAWTAELYADDEAKIKGFVFASHLMFNLIKGHCLVDGNKRVAWISLIDSLASLGWMVEATDDEAESLCIQLCTDQDSSASDVQEWLLVPGRLVPWPPERS